MWAFSLVHWVIFALVFAVWIIPAWKIVSRAGFSGAWSLLLIVPILGAVMYWVFAFVRWPIDDAADHSRTFD
jgi:hypothetical protein